MHKNFLQGMLLLAILALGGVATATEDTTITTATMGEHIWISSSDDVPLTIIPDETVTAPSEVSVKTNKDAAWEVTAYINHANGKLETSSGTPLTEALVLTVGSTDISPLGTTSAPTTIYDDAETNHKTGGTPRAINPTFKQGATYDDGPAVYTGTITFTAEYKMP